MGRVTCSRRICLKDKCRNARSCACTVCGPLKSVNPNIYDACIDACQEAPRPVSHRKYLCDTVTPEVLFNRYGLVLCGFDPQSTTEAELYHAHEATQEKKQAAQTKVIYAMGAILLVLLAVFILR